MQNDRILARTRDQFYTQEVVAEECLKQLLPFIDFKNPLWLEPSAGTGAFLSILEKYNYKYVSFDIEPKHASIISKDFLTIDENDITYSLPLYKNNLVTIGNPPFGKNSSLAIKFFNKSAKYSRLIGMILPATFEKESIQKRLDKTMHLVGSFKLSNEQFLFDGKLVPVPTVFQVWEKKEIKRVEKESKLISTYFEFVKKEEANFSIQRVGVAAGKVKKEFLHLSPSSHYFIKASDEIYKTFSSIDWSSVKYNTAGNPSISKKELIVLLEDKLIKK